ncbi:hypothetical protein F01_500015 [Burkholderia cenocepacia]|nr:hypothetical protein F01_500015 [Burkholderia cenocepacia]
MDLRDPAEDVGRQRLAAGGWLGRRRLAIPAAADRAADLHQRVAARARDARLDDRDAVEQLHPHRAGEGPAGLDDRAASCAEARADAGRVAVRHGLHHVDHGGRRHRIGVRAAGPRAARRERRDQPRLHAGARPRRADDRLRGAVQPAGRPRVRVARSAHPLLSEAQR